MNNVRCTTEGEKSNKSCARSHTKLFVSLRRTAQEYISLTVISLFILRENSHSEGEILDNFQKFCVQHQLGCVL